MALFLYILSSVLAEEDLWTFRSPLLPNHATKFNTYGDAIPMKKYVRLHPPLNDTKGAIVTASTIDLIAFEIETIINIGSHMGNDSIGASLWLTNSTYGLGTLFWLSETFIGIGVVVDVATHNIYAFQSHESIDFSYILQSSSCEYFKNMKQLQITLKIKDNTLEIWLRERAMRKCLEVILYLDSNNSSWIPYFWNKLFFRK